jgi:hypothetical protein
MKLDQDRAVKEMADVLDFEIQLAKISQPKVMLNKKYTVQK